MVPLHKIEKIKQRLLDRVERAKINPNFATGRYREWQWVLLQPDEIDYLIEVLKRSQKQT